MGGATNIRGESPGERAASHALSECRRDAHCWRGRPGCRGRRRPKAFAVKRNVDLAAASVRYCRCHLGLRRRLQLRRFGREHAHLVKPCVRRASVVSSPDRSEPGSRRAAQSARAHRSVGVPILDVLQRGIHELHFRHERLAVDVCSDPKPASMRLEDAVSRAVSKSDGTM